MSITGKLYRKMCIRDRSQTLHHRPQNKNAILPAPILWHCDVSIGLYLLLPILSLSNPRSAFSAALPFLYIKYHIPCSKDCKNRTWFSYPDMLLNHRLRFPQNKGTQASSALRSCLSVLETRHYVSLRDTIRIY